jgi:RHS repeat-associated protein
VLSGFGLVNRSQTLARHNQTKYGIGKLTQVTSVEGIDRSFDYDRFGRVQQETVKDKTQPEPAWALNYEYDFLGRLAALDYPPTGSQPFRVEYGYKGNGGIESVWDASTPSKALLWRQLSRNDADESTAEQFGDTETVTRGYDASFNLRMISGVFSANGVGTGKPFQRLHFDWDVDNLLKTRIDTDLAITEGYTHDFFGRLESWSVAQGCGTTTWNYGYDDWGNMRSRATAPGGLQYDSTTYSYTTLADVSHPHAVKHIETSSGSEKDDYSYDPAGQVTSGRGNKFTWTPHGLPFTVVNAQRSSSYLYDGLGSRVVENQGPVGGSSTDTRTVTFNGLFEFRVRPTVLAGEYVYNVFGGAGLVAQVRRTAMPATQKVQFIHPDLLGNPDAITTSATAAGRPVGKLVERGKYEPFGERRLPSALARPSAVVSHAVGASVGFTGQQPDDSFGLVNMRGRVYDTKTTRFISPDPLASPHSQRLNRYSYAYNSPVTFTDPSGFDGVNVCKSYDASTGQATDMVCPGSGLDFSNLPNVSRGPLRFITDSSANTAQAANDAQ